MKTHLSEEVLRHREALITDEYGGIYPVHEAFYICSIQYAADRAAEAFLRVDRAVTTKSDATLTFAAVQEALTYAGALSRFFWPIKTSKLAKARGERLRAAFGLAETSPLRSRRLRNALEHFDEKLDLFLLTDPVGCFFRHLSSTTMRSLMKQ